MHESTRECPSDHAAHAAEDSDSSAPVASFNHEAIAQRAYRIYLLSGCQVGLSQQHWEQAERELQAEHQASFDEQETVFQESPIACVGEFGGLWECSSDLLVWCRGGRHFNVRRFLRPPPRCDRE